MQWRTLRLLAVTCACGLAWPAAADQVVLVSPNEEASGAFGTSVSGIPDVNGDGFDDVIVGAPGETVVGFANAGRVYIFSGATGLLIRTRSSPNDAVNGRFGGSVSGIPDITGDGRGDYIVGARGEAGPGGRAYVYNGATGGLVRTHVSQNPEAGGEFGRSVAGIEDLNNDGRGDYIVGAPLETIGGSSDAGRAYVYSGSTGLLIRTVVSPNVESFGRFGYSVGGVPDASNDGRGDYIIGAPDEDPGGLPLEAGKAYLFSGNTGALLHSLTSGSPQSAGRFGWSVAGIPDSNGDGRGDVIVGAPEEDAEDTGGTDFDRAGAAYRFSGSNGAQLSKYVEKDTEIQNDGLFGYDVDGLPDVNGGGLGDVIIGAPGWPSYTAYVYTNSGGLPATLETTDPLGANQFWGSAVAAVGDLNGDGRGDYIVGGSGSDNFPDGPSQSGRAVLYRPLANDGCSLFSTSLELVIGPNDFSTIGAAEGSSEDDCPEFEEPGLDAWFFHEAICTGTLLISTCNSANFNTKIAAYGGCGFSGLFSCDLSDLLGCADNFFLCPGGTTLLAIPVVDGECYRIRISGAGSQSGFGTVTLSMNCDCVGDINEDGKVDGADLGLLLSGWGGGGSTDLNGSGTTDGADLGELLAAWGDCP